MSRGFWVLPLATMFVLSGCSGGDLSAADAERAGADIEQDLKDKLDGN